MEAHELLAELEAWKDIPGVWPMPLDAVLEVIAAQRKAPTRGELLLAARTAALAGSCQLEWSPGRGFLVHLQGAATGSRRTLRERIYDYLYRNGPHIGHQIIQGIRSHRGATYRMLDEMVLDRELDAVEDERGRVYSVATGRASPAASPRRPASREQAPARRGRHVEEDDDSVDEGPAEPVVESRGR